MKQVLVGDLIESDEAGFACSKTRLVESGLAHLRPFNIGSDGALDLSEVYQVDPSEAPKGKGQLLAGDILFNNTNSAELVGKSAVVTVPMTAGFSNHLTRVRVDRSRVDPFWLSFWVRKLQASGYFTANATQLVSQAAYRTSDLGKLPIDLPSLAEQRAVVDLLSRAEGIVRLRRQAQQKAAELIPAIFVDMFGDPTVNPKGWPLSRLGDLLSAPIRNGISPARSGRVHGKVLTLSAITRGGFDETSVKESTFASPIASSDEVRSVDFLVCRGNGNRMLVGAGCFPLRDMPGVAFPDTAIAVRPAASLLDRAYFSALWGTSFVRRQIDAIAKTTNGTFKINQAGLADIRVLLPELERQSAFARHAEAVESIKSQQALALQKATATFEALLARAFASQRAASVTHEAEEAVS
jgi:type I restriction enzyme, S subunit